MVLSRYSRCSSLSASASMAAACASRASRSAFKDIVAATRRTNAASARLSLASRRACSWSAMASRRLKTEPSNARKSPTVALVWQVIDEAAPRLPCDLRKRQSATSKWSLHAMRGRAIVGLGCCGKGPGAPSGSNRSAVAAGCRRPVCRRRRLVSRDPQRTRSRRLPAG